MISALFAVATVGVILACSEYLWQKKLIAGEYSRKLIHILIGCFVASMPFWISYGWIIIFGLGALFLSIINNRRKLFKAGHGINRRSYGDSFLAVAMIACAAFQPNHWMFMVAILHVSLADGLAAVSGTFFEKRNVARPYKVFGQKKTIAGTLTFVVVSLLIMVVTVRYSGLFSGAVSVWALLAGLPLVAAATENLGVFGTDNLLLPLLVLLALSAFKF